ncbi:hypothetical protein DPMN_090031 [Dreissena polymorpha]|uniref:Uncharacterized protein n=1 Tax=Dreissena polymorpha TaxID=45954 RepID=A0A9D4KX00_DREPO|nr:hypothetical protein DPMN_090031 [Dreissena polymorpha]
MARQRQMRLVMGPCIVEIDRIVIRDVQYQFEVNRCTNEEVNFQGSSAYSVGGGSGQDGRTAEKTTSGHLIWTDRQKPHHAGWTDGKMEERTDGQRQNNIPLPMAGDN